MIGMVDSSLPNLQLLLRDAWRSEEIQELLARVRPSKDGLLDELSATLDERRVWRRVTTERDTFQALVHDLASYQGALLRTRSPEYVKIEDNLSLVEAVVQELEMQLGVTEDEADLAKVRRTVDQARAMLDDLRKPQKKRTIARAAREIAHRLNAVARRTAGTTRITSDQFDFDTVYEEARLIRSDLRTDLDSILRTSDFICADDRVYLDIRDRVVAARKDLKEAIIQKALLPLHLRPSLSKRLEEQDRDYHGTILRTTKAPGLAYLSNREYDVPTRSHTALAYLMNNLHGGSIGLSGPRGAGKTTLLRGMTEPGREFRGRAAVVSELVPAPVEYLPKEFVLHLFQRVCNHVITSSSTDAASSGENRVNASTFGLLSKLATASLTFGAAAWFTTTLINRPPHFASAMFATVLGALIPLSLHDFLCQFTTETKRSVPLLPMLQSPPNIIIGSSVLLGIATGSVSVRPVQNAAVFFLLAFVLALSVTLLNYLRNLLKQHFKLLPPMHAIVALIFISATANKTLKPEMPSPPELAFFAIASACMLAWICIDAIELQQKHTTVALRGVLFANGCLAFLRADQNGLSTIGLAWLTWGSVLIVLAILGGLSPVSAFTPVATGAFATVPLIFGAIAENWIMAVVGVVLLLAGYASGPYDFDRNHDDLLTSFRSQMVNLLFRSAGALPLMAGSTLLTVAGASSRIELPPVASVIVMFIGIAMYCGARDLHDRMAAQKTRAATIPQLNTGTWADSLVDEARHHIDEVRFQLTESTTWSRVLKASGGSGFSVGVDSSSGGGTSRHTVARTYPEIVDSFRAFLGKVCTYGPVVIAIDEIDKLEPSAAGKFLNDIKAVFGVPGCYYLVSLSEEAMASFERRGLPIRDVFESSFDDVVHIDYLTFEECHTLLNERVAGLPLALIGTCYVMSGGVPRELIRIARRVFAIVHKHDTWLIDEILTLLFHAELEERSRGIVMSVNGLEVEAAGTVLAVVDHAKTPLSPEHGTTAQCTVERDDPLRRMIGALYAYNYVLSTLVSFLHGASEGRIKRTGSSAHPEYLGGLAVARQLLSIDSNLAWAAVSAFREKVALPPVDQPALFG